MCSCSVVGWSALTVHSYCSLVMVRRPRAAVRHGWWRHVQVRAVSSNAHAHCTAAAPTPSLRMRIDLSNLSRHLSPYFRTTTILPLFYRLISVRHQILILLLCLSLRMLQYPINAYDSFSQQITRWNFPIQVFPSNHISLSDLKGGQESMCNKPRIQFIHAEIKI